MIFSLKSNDTDADKNDDDEELSWSTVVTDKQWSKAGLHTVSVSLWVACKVQTMYFAFFATLLKPNID